MNSSILQNLVILMTLAGNKNYVLGSSVGQSEVDGFPSIGKTENLLALWHVLQRRKDFINNALRVLGTGIVAGNHYLIRQL